MAEANWYWAENGKENGPVAGSAIVRLVADGKLGAEDMIWKEGMPDWIPVRKVPALVKYLNKRAGTPVAAVAVAAPAPVIAYQNAPTDPRAIHQFVPDPAGKMICPHCSVPNPTDAQYCESCGMALPIPNFGPRIVDGAAFASTAAGQQLQSEELHKQAKRAATALLAVAVIQTVIGGIVIAAVSATSRAVPIAQNPLALTLIASAVIFWGLYIWARKQPLPAAIVGLVLYVTLKAIDVVAAISSGSIGNPSAGNGIGGSGISWVNIVIIAVLAQAISAGLKYRKMQSGAIQTTA